MSRLAGLLVNSAGNRSDGRTARGEHANLIFREADVIGHPLSALDALFAAGNVVCHSDTTPGMPYFQSALDALAWRSDLPESLYPASVIPGLRELGSWPGYTWGPIHPRTGWAVQSDEAKAAALIAQRAADIVTRERQSHLYRSMASTATHTEQQIWPPGPLMDADATTGQWQMLSPTAETSCAAFGENDLVSATSWGGDRIAEGGDYIWNLWRPYRCCARKGALFLFSIDEVAPPLYRRWRSGKSRVRPRTVPGTTKSAVQHRSPHRLIWNHLKWWSAVRWSLASVTVAASSIRRLPSVNR